MTKEEDQQNQNDNVEEPGLSYNTVHFFDSFEEMNRYDHQQYANMTPEERLRTVFKMRKRIWPNQQSPSCFGKHIHIKK
jgi:hypothetical protein